MANNWEIVMLELNEVVTISLPFHTLNICNLRCHASDFDHAMVILNKVTNKIAFGNPRTCNDEAEKKE